MGLWDWIKRELQPVEKPEKPIGTERAYWWVSEKQRKYCREVLDDTGRWGAWHRCMQEERKPFRAWQIAMDIKSIIRIIKQIVGVIKKGEEIKITELPPVKLKIPIPKPFPKPPKPPKKPKEKIPKEKRKKKKEKVKKKRSKLSKKFKIRKLRKKGLMEKSKLLIGRFSWKIKWRNLIKLEFVKNFEKINEEMLDEINENKI